MAQPEHRRPRVPEATRGTAASAAPEAFEEFFDRLLPRAIGVGTRILGSRVDGEDAAVEGMARAYVAWARIGQVDHRDAWVLRVTANVAYDHVRRELRARRLQPESPPPASATDDVDLRLTLLPALKRLSRRQREVVVLGHVAGLTQEEIASVLGCSAGSVKVHSRRALEKLRAQLGDADVLDDAAVPRSPVGPSTSEED